MRGTNTAGNVGGYSNGKVPNITAGARFGHSGAYGFIRITSEAFTATDRQTAATYPGSASLTGDTYLGLDASRSSNVYDSAFTKVVPNGVSMYYCIKY